MCSREALFAGRFSRDMKSMSACLPEKAGRVWSKAMNHEDETKHFTVVAYTEDGLECAVELTVAPDFVEAPAFVEVPKLEIADGKAMVSYKLDLAGRGER